MGSPVKSASIGILAGLTAVTLITSPAYAEDGWSS